MNGTTIAGSGSLTLLASSNTATSSTLAVPTTVAKSASLSLANSTIAGAFTNDGVVTMSNQNVTIGAGGAILNRGEWTMSAASGQNCQFFGNCSNFNPVSFTNEGTLRATGSGFKAFNNSCSPVVFTSTGSVFADEGELRFSCNASLSSGAAVASGATLSNQSNLTFGGLLAGDGAFNHLAGTTTVNAGISQSVEIPTTGSGTVVINSAVVRPTLIAMNGTTIAGSGSLTLLASSNTATSSTLAVPTTVAKSASLSLANSTIAGAFTNDGVVTMSNQNVTIGPSGAILNRGEWTMSAASGQVCQVFGNCNNSNPVSFTNEGTLRATGAGFKAVNNSCAPIVFANTGSVFVDAGTLSFNCALANLASNRLAGGTWETSADLRVPQAIRTLAADLTLRGSGDIRSINGNTAQLAGLARIEPRARGRIVNTGTLPLSPFGGTLLNEGFLTLEGNTAVAVNGAFACSASSSLTQIASSTNTAISATTGALDGAFTLAFDPSFAPSVGTTWTLASFPSGRSGAFTATTLPPNTTLTLDKASITVSIEKEVPVADLVSDGPIVAKSISAGAPMTALFIERNAGDADAVAPWSSRVDFVASVSTPTLIATFGTSVANADLAPKATAERTLTGVAPFVTGTVVPRLSIDIDGDIAESSSKNDGEANNVVFGAPIEILAANLVAANVTAPTTIFTTQSTTISFATSNTGAGDSIGPSFTDRVFLSLDTTLDASDTLLGSVVRTNATLASGASLAGSVNFTLPESTASGAYSILIAVDATSARFESNDADNTLIAGSVEVQPPAAPDLIVTAVEAPSSIVAGQPFTLRWTVRNQGNAVAQLPWSDRAFRSADAAFGGDQFLGAPVAATAALAAGAERTVELVLTAPQEEADFFVFVSADANGQVNERTSGESNNVSAAIGPIQLRFPPNPDLTIASITVPSNVVAGTPISLTVVERNDGTAAVNTLRRIGVALSTNNVGGDSDDLFLGDISVSSALAIGEQSAVGASFVVPASVAGARFVVATADRLNEVDERPKEANNRAVSVAFEVLPPPRADLGVIAVAALENAVATQTATLSWTIANTGDATATGSWRDQIWLSQDDVLTSSDIMLVERVRSQTLAGGANYSDSAVVTLPDFVGSARLIARTDALNQVDEGADAASNILASAPFTIAAPARPDLVAAVLAAPTSAQAGDSVSVTWRGTNAGTASTSGSWSDRIYLSNDATLSADDLLLRTQPVSAGVLAPEASYQRTASVQIPVSYAAETKFFLAVVDALAVLTEGSESNNAGVSAACAVAATPAPDLVASSVVLPATGTFGEAIDVSWSVTNEGDLAAAGGFSDIVFLSTDALFSTNDIPVAVVGSGSAALAPGATSPRAASVQLPLANALLNGTYRLLIKTDGNASIEESDEGNNLVVSAPIALVRPALPDLTASFVSVPTEISFGQPFNVTLRMTNNGQADLTANSFFSISASGESQSILLAELFLSEDLPVGASVELIRQIATPQVTGGAFTLQVCADARGEIVESSESNNCSNSLAITPRQPNLVVTAISAPTSATAGDTISVTYTVENIGNGGASGFRGDLVALSDDATIGNDRTIAAPTIVQTIPAGAEVVRTVQCTIPTSVEGAQRVVVTADSTGSIEESAEGVSNAFIRTIVINIDPAPRPNLTVVAASAPASAVEGERLTANFTVTNNGLGVAEGGWVDKIYATRTDGPGFVTVGAAPGPNVLAVGASYNRSIDFTAPASGVWRITVVTDDASNVLESLSDGSSGEVDNTRIAQDALSVGGVVVTASVVASELELPAPTTLIIESRSQATGEPVANISGTRLTLVDGFPTTATFTTGSDGRAVVDVAPVANNAGVYGFGARAGNGTPAVQTQVVYWGASIQADASERRIAEGGAASGQILVRNLGELALEGAVLEVEAIGEGLSATASLGASTLGANESRFIDYAVTVGEGSEGGLVRFTLVTPKTTAKVAEFPVFAIEALPQLVAAPASIVRDMLVGEVDYVNVTVTNAGSVATGALSVQVAASPFGTLATPASLPPLAPGASTVVSLRLDPAEDLVIGPYTANPWITVTDTANEGLGVGVPMTFNATSDATATVRVRTTNEFSFYATPPTYPNATVELVPSGATEAIASGLVDAEGFIEFTRVPVGNYTLRGTAPQHGGAQQSIFVGPGGLDLELFMSRVLVTYSWTVVPVPFSDQYTITITLNFETNVPAPVVTVEPVVLDLDALDGEVSYREFTITNHGLVAADNTLWEIENTDRYEIIPLSPIVGDLLPGQSVSAPFLVIDHQFGQGLVGGPDCVQRPAMRAVWELLCGNTLGKYSFLLGVDKTVECPNSSGPSFGGSCFGCAGGFNPPGFGNVPGASQPTPPGEYKAPNCEACFDSCGKSPLGFLNCMKPKMPFLPGQTPQPVVCGGTAAAGFINPTTEALADMVRCMGDAELLKVGEGLFGSHKSSAPQTLVGAVVGASIGFGGAAGQGKGFGEAAANAGKEFAKGVAKEFPAGKMLGCLADAFKACNCLGNQAGQGGTAGEEFEFPTDPFSIPDAVEAEDQLVEEFVNLGLMAMRIARPYAYQFGSFSWWEQMDAEFTDTVTSASGENVTVADCEAIRVAFVELLIDRMFGNDGAVLAIDSAAALDLLDAYDAAPHAFVNQYTRNPLPRSELERLIARWNRTIDYNAMGIFTAADVPAGLSTDFIDVEKVEAYTASAVTAIAEVEQYGYPSLEEAFGAAFVVWLESLATPGQGLCTTLTIQLEQTVTLTRQAFEARLVLDNDTEFALESLRLDFQIVDANGEPAGERFVVLGPTLDTLTAVDGTGTLAAGASGSATFTLIPGDSAAPNAPTNYRVKGTLSYAVGGQTLSFPLFPAQITVLPNPSLELNYFIETQVFGDDPFTPELEPSVPFALGLWAKNAGGGVAGDVRIESGEPQIIENERDLLIDFDLIGTRVGAEARSPSLAVDLGDIAAGEVAVAEWLMTSTIQGEFVGYDVEISSLNGFNTPEFAVIDSATIEPLVRSVRADVPQDDGIPDFLVNQANDVNGLPDRIYLSEGAVEPVTPQMLTATVIDPLTLSVDASVGAGWRYIRLVDPSGGAKRIARVVRNDGRELTVGVNAWQTKFIDRSVPQPVLRADIHLFDRGGDGLYTIEFDPDSEAPSVVQWASVKGQGALRAALPLATGTAVSEPRHGGLANLIATFSEPIDPTSFDAVAVSIAAFDSTGAEVQVPATTVAAELTLGGTGADITFTPALPAGLRYCIRIVGATDLVGNLLVASSARLDVAVVRGDVTGDQRTNVTDFGAIATLLGVVVDRANPAEVRCDLDGNGTIAQADLALAMSSNGVDLRAAVNPCSTFALGATVATGDARPTDAASEALDAPTSIDELIRGRLAGRIPSAAASRWQRDALARGGDDAADHENDHENDHEHIIEGNRMQLGSFIASFPRGVLLSGLLAVRSTSDRFATGDGLAASEAIDAFALQPLGELDGWVVALAPEGHHTPASLAVLSAMLVGAGLDVGVVLHTGEGWVEVVGPDLTVQFRSVAPLDWQQRVLDGFGGFTPTALADGQWLLEGASRFGGDAWKVLRALRARRDVESVEAFDATNTAPLAEVGP